MIKNSLFVGIMSLACTGCIGVGFDRTTTVSIEKPVPLGHPSWPADGFERWACQADQEQTYRTKSDFIESWGEPHSIEVSNDKETWNYQESGRWCGLWLGLLIVPVPLVLPVCETYDKITFENNLAVRSTSRRFVETATGIMLVGPMGIPMPIPFYARAGKVTEKSSSIMTFPPSKSDYSCAWKTPQDDSTMSEENAS